MGRYVRTAPPASEASRMFELYGVPIESEVPLPGVPRWGGGAPRLRIEWGRQGPIRVGPDDEVLARLSLPCGGGYVLRSAAAGYLLRFHPLADFAISEDLRRVRAHPHRGADLELMPLLIIGNLMGFILALGDEDPLHASAVERHGTATALISRAGGGKSTLAAFLCTRGARLVTDDLLLLQRGPGMPLCRYGPREVRLRAGSVMHGRVNGPGRPTPDGRTAYALDGRRGEPPILRRFVVPRLVRSSGPPRARRLTGAETHRLLLDNPKVTGWMSTDHLQRRFMGLAAVAAAVPAYEVEIPWGKPLTEEIAWLLMDPETL
jgi:hypothetical protein